MTKQSYLDALEKQLAPLTEDERKDILLEFSCHIDEAMERKPELDEASLLASLPHPSVLAKQFLEEAGYATGSSENEKASNKSRSGGTEPKSDWFRSFFRYATSEHSEIEETFESIQRITINGISADLRAVPGTTCKVKIDGYWSEDTVPEINQTGTSLNIDLGKDAENLSIELPADLVEFMAQSVSGDMHCTLPVGVSARVGSTSGDLTVQADSGHIHAKSVSGDLHINGKNLDLDLKTTSGDIQLGDFDGVVAASTASGDIRIACAGSPDTVEITTMSGDVSIKLPSDANPAIRASSVSGDVMVRNARTTSRPGKNFVEVNGTSGEITAHTMSGDIMIQ